MSREVLQRFLNRLASSDREFAYVKACGNDAEAIVNFGKKLGYDFNRQDLEDLRQQINDFFTNMTKRKLDELDMAPNIASGVQAVGRFARIVYQDKTVAAKISEFGFDDPEAIVTYGNQLGFIFDKKDLAAFADQLLSPSVELSDEELELSTGGIDNLSAVALGYSTASAYVGLIASAAAVAVTKNN